MKDKLIIGGYQGAASLHTKSIEYFIKEMCGNFDINFIMDITNAGEKASSLILKTQQELAQEYQKIRPQPFEISESLFLNPLLQEHKKNYRNTITLLQQQQTQTQDTTLLQHLQEQEIGFQQLLNQIQDNSFNFYSF